MLPWEATVCCLFSGCGTQVSCLFFKNFWSNPFVLEHMLLLTFALWNSPKLIVLFWSFKKTLLLYYFCPSLPDSRKAQIANGTVLLHYLPHLTQFLFLVNLVSFRQVPCLMRVCCVAEHHQNNTFGILAWFFVHWAALSSSSWMGEFSVGSVKFWKNFLLVRSDALQTGTVFP